MKLQRNNKYSRKFASGIASILLASTILTGCNANADNVEVKTQEPIEQVTTEKIKDEAVLSKIDQGNNKSQQNGNELSEYKLKYPDANWCMCDINVVLIKDSESNYKVLEAYNTVYDDKIYLYDLFTEEKLFELPYTDDFFEMNDVFRCINAQVNKAVDKCDYLKDKEIVYIGNAGYETLFRMDLGILPQEYSNWINFQNIYGYYLSFSEFFLTTEQILYNYRKYVPQEYQVSTIDLNLSPEYSERDKLEDCWKVSAEEVEKRILELNIPDDDLSVKVPIGTVQTLVFKDSNNDYKMLNIVFNKEDYGFSIAELYTGKTLFVLDHKGDLLYNESTGIYVNLDFSNIREAIPYFEDKTICYIANVFETEYFLKRNYDELCKKDSINYRPVSDTFISMAFNDYDGDIDYSASISEIASYYVRLPEGMYVTAKELGFEKDKVKSLN